MLSVGLTLAQTPEQVADGSVFLYDATTQPCAPTSGAVRPPLALGTGFTVFLQSGSKDAVGKDLGVRVLITASHVISGRTSVIFRVNHSDGKGYACQIVNLVREGPLAGRTVHTLDKQPQVDLAAIRMRNIPDSDPLSFAYGMILDKGGREQWHVHVGTDVFTVGYMFGYAGLSVNRPITRFGKVALLTDEAWLAPDPKTGKNALEEGDIVEMQNVPGLSGAPVMLSSPQWSVDEKTGAIQARVVQPFIIGVVKDALGSPIGGSQGVAVIEKGDKVRELLRAIVQDYKAAGVSLILE